MYDVLILLLDLLLVLDLLLELLLDLYLDLFLFILLDFLALSSDLTFNNDFTFLDLLVLVLVLGIL